MISSPAGNDLLFDEASLEQGRFFNNKLWNALKLLKIWAGQMQENGRQTTDHWLQLQFSKLSHYGWYHFYLLF